MDTECQDCTHHTLGPSLPWRAWLRAWSWGESIHPHTTTSLTSAVSDHKTYTERIAHVGLWNSHRSSLCISVSGPKIKLVLCKVSLKSTPCISAGSYRLINSWQKKLKGLNESPGCLHLLSPDWGDGGQVQSAHFSLTDLQKMFQSLGGSGHHYLPTSWCNRITKKENNRNKSESGRMWEYRRATSFFVAPMYDAASYTWYRLFLIYSWEQMMTSRPHTVHSFLPSFSLPPFLPARFLTTRSHVAHVVLAPNTADDCLDLLNLLSFYHWSAKITGTNPQVSFCKLSFVYDRQRSTNWATAPPHPHVCGSTATGCLLW